MKGIKEFSPKRQVNGMWVLSLWKDKNDNWHFCSFIWWRGILVTSPPIAASLSLFFFIARAYLVTRALRFSHVVAHSLYQQIVQIQRGPLVALSARAVDMLCSFIAKRVFSIRPICLIFRVIMRCWDLIGPHGGSRNFCCWRDEPAGDQMAYGTHNFFSIFQLLYFLCLVSVRFTLFMKIDWLNELYA